MTRLYRTHYDPPQFPFRPSLLNRMLAVPSSPLEALQLLAHQWKLDDSGDFETLRQRLATHAQENGMDRPIVIRIQDVV